VLVTFRTLVPGFWMGLLVALAFIETPLKFLAPGVTVPLALGIGRLVLTAAELASAVLLIVLTVISLLRPRLGRGGLAIVAGLWATLLAQLALIRPALNARTDTVLAGGDPGDSPLHGIYVASDVVLLVLLVAYLVCAVRQGRSATTRREPSPRDAN